MQILLRPKLIDFYSSSRASKLLEFVALESHRSAWRRWTFSDLLQQSWPLAYHLSVMIQKVSYMYTIQRAITLQTLILTECSNSMTFYKIKLSMIITFSQPHTHTNTRALSLSLFLSLFLSLPLPVSKTHSLSPSISNIRTSLLPSLPTFT